MTLVSTLNPVAQSSYLCSWTLSPGVRYQIKLNLIQNTAIGIFTMQFNGDSGANYNWFAVEFDSSVHPDDGIADTKIGLIAGYSVYVGGQIHIDIDITTKYGNNMLTECKWNGGFVYSSSANYPVTIIGSAQYNGASNLSSVTFLTSGGTFSGNLSLYTFN